MQNSGTYKHEETTNNFFFFEDSDLSGLKDWQRKMVDIMAQVPSKAELLKPLIQLLVTAINPAKIYMLNRSSPVTVGEIEFIDLLLVISNSVPFTELEPIMEMPYLINQRISCSLHNEGNLLEGLRNGHMFYSLHCTPENLVYDNKARAYPVSGSMLLKHLKAKAWDIFAKYFGKAQDFKLAGEYLNQNFPDRPNISVFMLHQAVEATYTGIINGLNGYDINTHKIRTLKKHIRRCAPQLYDIFPDNTGDENRLLDKLENAYVDARYGNYDISKDDLNILFDRITILIESAKPIVEAIVGVFSNDPIE